VRWRPTLFKLHRDAGFLGLGLTLVYAVSGVATNHKHDWNYNLSTELTELKVGTPAELLATQSSATLSSEEDAALVAALGRALGEARAPRNAFWRGPDRFSLFYDAGDRDTVDYSPSTGLALRKRMAARPFLRSLNFLHLNEPGRAWTYVADAFAGLLAFLGLSGVVMVKGKYGLKGRGGVLMALGLLLPVAALLLFGRL
jgi:hypothetical protein